MKKKFMAGLATVALGVGAFGLLAPVQSAPSSTEAKATGYVNPLLAEVKAGQAKRIKYELKATAWLLVIPVEGKAEFEVFLEDETYTMNTHVKTTGVADVFVDYDLHVAASGYIEDDALSTYNYVSQNIDGKKNRRVEMIYGEDDVKMIANPGFGDLGFPPAEPEQKLAALDPITGFISSAFKPRPADKPCGDTIKLFDGKQLTHLNFTYVRKTTVKTPAYSGPATECHVQVDRVAGYNKGDKGKNLSGVEGPMKMYFGEPVDGFVAPVKLVVDTEDIGEITVVANKINIENIKSIEDYKRTH